MTIRLIEGFDVYPDVSATSQGVQARWVMPAGRAGFDLVPGRFGGQALQIEASTPRCGYPIAEVGSGLTTLCAGFAFLLLQGGSALPNTNLRLQNGGVGQTDVCGLGINANNQLVFWVSVEANVIATSAQSLTVGSWRYIDFQLSVAASGGTLTLYLDGVEAMNVSGDTGAAPVDAFTFCSDQGGGGNYTAQVDDVYVTDTLARLGERRVETLYPNANAVVAWTPLANANWQEVSELHCDGDASYVSTTAAGTQDTYAINSLASNPLTIDAVQVRVAVRKDDGSSHVLHTLLNSQGTVAAGPDFAIAGTYLYDVDIHPTDPDGGGAWTAARVNGALIGQVLVS